MNTPKEIIKEYEHARMFKNSLGNKGLYRQNVINRRFFAGDQWYGANTGSDRPLVRHNIIKRIGEYKTGSLLENDIRIEFSAEGISSTLLQKQNTKDLKASLSAGEYIFNKDTDENEIRLLTDTLSDYLEVVKNKLCFKGKLADILKNSFITGTGVLYTYWDTLAAGGKGDIACEVLPIENLYFGDSFEDSVENQPYIILVSVVNTEKLRRTAQAFGLNPDRIISDRPDNKTVLYTKLYKEYDGSSYKIMAVSVTEKAFVRPVYDTHLTRYPINILCWDKRENCVYGESEITHLLPNQIAINRMLTANVWASMSMGMPIMTVNGDTVTSDITNEPGQIIKVYGTNEDVAGAIHYITPPDFSANFAEGISSLIKNTLDSSGAGITDIEKLSYNNTAAVKSVIDTFGISSQSLKIRYEAFLVDVALLWLDFFINKYGKRNIHIQDENGSWYFPFDSNRYSKLSFLAKAIKEEKNEAD
ncbi:MAG: hypothetical protein E7568_02015 [Ruminococcaceae bacterium]|nr:hypothetical protein [Oscillospiraceae bacterium]